jgi:lipoyl-dependent peroxiredoxin subunit D
MSIESLKNTLPDFAKDIKLNLSTILTAEGAPDLQDNQIAGIALTSAYTTGNSLVIQTVLDEVTNILSDAEITAAKSAATIMAMNNIYYRFIHLSSDKSFSSMPARLRMNVIANPGIEKVDFELYSLAASALNGCGMCMDAHTNELIKSGMSKLAIQSSIRIASVINATSMAIGVST